MPTYIVSENTTAQNGTGTLYSGVTDTYLWSSNPTTNYGTNANIGVGKFTSGDNEHGLLLFGGLSNIPSSETVTSATLYLYLNFSTGTYSIDIRRVLQNWGVNTCTWNTYDGTNSWNTAGCLGSGTDRVATVVSSTSVGNTTGQYYALPCTSLVSDIVDGTIATDEGFHLERADAGNDFTAKTFTSSNGTNGQLPELVVVTTVASGGSPSQLTLLGAA